MAKVTATKRHPKRHLPDGRQAAILLLRLFDLRDQAREKPMTRAHLTSSMLRRLWCRPRLSPEFLRDVGEWLLAAGWVFFDVGSTYAAVRVTAVKKWPRVFSKLMKEDLRKVATGDFEYDNHEGLLWDGEPAPDDDGEGADDASANISTRGEASEDD